MPIRTSMGGLRKPWAMLAAVWGCASTSGGSELTARQDGNEGAPLILFQWEAESSTAGRLRGVGPEGVVYVGQMALSERSKSEGGIPERGAVEPGTESGAQVFSPFPEQWPRRSRNAVERVRTELVDERGRTLECRFAVPSPDEGIRPPVDGVCRDPSGNSYRARIE
jgi:hypothetical protein